MLKSGKGLPVSLGINTGEVMLGFNVGEGSEIGLTLGSVFEPRNIHKVLLCTFNSEKCYLEVKLKLK